jgi:hypothetical protein
MPRLFQEALRSEGERPEVEAPWKGKSVEVICYLPIEQGGILPWSGPSYARRTASKSSFSQETCPIASYSLENLPV